MTHVETMSLKARIEAFAAETAEERERLEAERDSLAERRNAEVAAIQDRHMRAMRAEVEEARERWRERLREIDETLATAKRLDRALNPPAPKPKPKAAGTSRKPPQWRPKDGTLREALRAMRESEADTVPTITEASSLSRAAIDTAIAVLREDGFVRLTGERKAGNSHTKVRTYAMTPAGEAFLMANEAGDNGAQA